MSFSKLIKLWKSADEVGVSCRNSREESGGTWMPDEKYPGMRADARLFNAAPDLYDACKALFDAPHQEQFAARLNDEEMAALDRMKAALKKAEAE